MRNSFDSVFSFSRIFVGFVIILIIALFIFRGTFVYQTFKSGKPVYQINVHTLNTNETYLTTEFKKDSSNGCISFKDEIGMKRVICGSYTITEY